MTILILLAIAAGITFLTCFSLMAFVLIVEPRTAVTIKRLGKIVRRRGEGIHFIFRLFGIEKVDKIAPIEIFQYIFNVEAETGYRDVVPVRITVEGEAWPEYLDNYHKFSEEERKKAIEERVRHLCTIEFHKYGGRDAVYADLKNLTPLVADALRSMIERSQLTFERYLGARIISVLLTDIEPPERLKNAELAREEAEELRKAKAEDWESVMERARKAVDEAEKRGETLSMEKAIEKVLVNDEKIKKNINQIGVDRNIKDIIQIVAEAFRGGKQK